MLLQSATQWYRDPLLDTQTKPSGAGVGSGRFVGVAVGVGISVGVAVTLGVTDAVTVACGMGDGVTSAAISSLLPPKSKQMASNAAKPPKEPFLLFRRLAITSPSYVSIIPCHSKPVFARRC